MTFDASIAETERTTLELKDCCRRRLLDADLRRIFVALSASTLEREIQSQRREIFGSLKSRAPPVYRCALAARLTAARATGSTASRQSLVKDENAERDERDAEQYAENRDAHNDADSDSRKRHQNSERYA